VAEKRSTEMQIRLSPTEKQAIHRRAARAGLKPSEFVRREALGREGSGSAPTDAPPEAAERTPDNAGISSHTPAPV